jgi:CRISPR-associated protein Cas4
MPENDDYIAINLIQHYTYCPRQWGFIALESQWRENAFVVKGDIVHKKVDDPFDNEKRGRLRVSRSLPVFSEELGLNGILDLVEFEENEKGVFIKQLGGKFNIKIVEYKSGKPNVPGQVNFHDALQLTAQILCVEEMFGGKCEGYIFYDTIKRRVKFSEFAEYKAKLIEIVNEMRKHMESGEIPKEIDKDKCGGCSMSDVCLPKLKFSDLEKRLLKRESDIK